MTMEDQPSHKATHGWSASEEREEAPSWEDLHLMCARRSMQDWITRSGYAWRLGCAQAAADGSLALAALQLLTAPLQAILALSRANVAPLQTRWRPFQATRGTTSIRDRWLMPTAPSATHCGLRNPMLGHRDGHGLHSPAAIRLLGLSLGLRALVVREVGFTLATPALAAGREPSSRVGGGAFAGDETPVAGDFLASAVGTRLHCRCGTETALGCVLSLTACSSALASCLRLRDSLPRRWKPPTPWLSRKCLKSLLREEKCTTCPHWPPQFACCGFSKLLCGIL
jgi:hypothetical protein